MNPYRVTSPSGRMPIWVIDKKVAPLNFMLLATRAERKACIRVAGGCSGMGPSEKQEMMAYFRAALRGYRGMIFSGGTRQLVANNEPDMMVTEIPGVIAEDNPGCIALGTAPRVGTMSLAGDSHFEIDDGTLVNPNMSGMLIVQDGADENLGWDGDLDTYFGMMTKLHTFAGWGAVGMIAWNGGGVTEKEILRSARLGFPTFLVNGSGRKTNEIANRFLNGDRDLIASLPNNHKLFVVDINNPQALRDQLLASGFLAKQDVATPDIVTC